MSKRELAYGAWESPVTTDLLAGKTIGLGALSADGAALYWLEGRPAEGGRTVLVRRGPDGGIADLTPPPFDVASRVHEYGGGAYAASAGRVLFSNKSDGAVWLIDGGETRAVAAVPGCRYADFSFVGTGHAVCVREDHRGRPPNDPKAAIVMLDLAQPGEGAVLVEGPDFLSSPRASPDGTQLAWLEWDHPAMPWDGTRLCLGALAGERLTDVRIVAGEAQQEALIQPDWSPDGVLHVCSDRSNWWNLYRLEAGSLTPLCPVDAEIGGPHWSFGQRYFAFRPDGSLVATVVRDGRAEAVSVQGGQLHPLAIGPVAGCPRPMAEGYAWISAPPDASPAIMLGHTEIRSSGPAVLAADDISVAQAIGFPTDDGHTGHAFWYPPANAAFTGPADALPPLVVLIHGGPTSMTGSSFGLRIQWWTSRGIGVVDVNYGGSTGFGRAYRQRLQGQWGVVDVADCIAAARHLVAAGLVDGKRIAIRGGSAGGFTTLAAITQTDLFGAAASLYGVGDLTLLAGDTHKFESRYLDGLIGRLPQDAAVYHDRSPINHVDRIATPVIFFQGAEDKVVPPNQARTMVDAMAAKHLPVAHYEFAGEAHGFRKAETIRRVLELELDFYGQIFGFTPAGLSEHAVIRR